MFIFTVHSAMIDARRSSALIVNSELSIDPVPACLTHSMTTCLYESEKRRDSASRSFARRRTILLNGVRTILVRVRHEQGNPIVPQG